MRQKIFLCCWILVPALSSALGDIAHNYVAEGVATQVAPTNAHLQSVLTINHNAYLVGSDYPDTGYVPGFHYGEDSHWPYFVTPFAAYIKKNCRDASTPEMQAHCDKLTAFLLGAVTHIKSDIVSHWTYYNFVALHDFGSESTDDWNKAHAAMDPASDYYVIVRKHIYDHPVIWWVPVADLVNVYAIMLQNKVISDTVTANDIIEANAIYYVAMGLTEDTIAYPAYSYDALYYIPWGIANLENPDPQYGAFPEMIRQSAQYVEDVWNSIEGNTPLATQPFQKTNIQETVRYADVVKKALADKLITITPTKDAFGDVTFTPTSLQYTSPDAKAEFKARLQQVKEN